MVMQLYTMGNAISMNLQCLVLSIGDVSCIYGCKMNTYWPFTRYISVIPTIQFDRRNGIKATAPLPIVHIVGRGAVGLFYLQFKFLVTVPLL